VFPDEAAAMRYDRIGLIGLPMRTYECIKMRVDDGMKFAVSPEDVDAAWKALAVAGVCTSRLTAVVAHVHGGDAMQRCCLRHAPLPFQDRSVSGPFCCKLWLLEDDWNRDR